MTCETLCRRYRIVVIGIFFGTCRKYRQVQFGKNMCNDFNRVSMVGIRKLSVSDFHFFSGKRPKVRDASS
jgi:hypothetical protein